MNLSLKGRVAVVLAGSAGVGLGVAMKMAEEGCSLAICSRNGEKLQEAKKILQVHSNSVFIGEVDLINKESIDKFLDNVVNCYGRIDILVCNSGGPPAGGCLNFSDFEYEKAFQLLVMSKIRAINKVLPWMIDKKWGRIISLESTSIKMAINGLALSNTFRAASAAFIKTVSMEYGHLGVRAHSILMGPFLTDRVYDLGFKEANKAGMNYESWVAAEAEKLPLGRFGEPYELGNLAAFLSSPVSDYMNGTSIAFDGGILRAAF